MQKKIIMFEGLGCSGKSTLIRQLSIDLNPLYKIEVLDNNHPYNRSLLFNRNNEISFPKGKFAFFTFRWTRLFLFIDYILKSKSNLFLLDRAILTNFIYAKVDKISESLLDGLILEVLNILNNKDIDYKTVIAECNIEIANNRFQFRENINIDQKIERNILFAPYYRDYSDYQFLGKVLIINTTNDIFQDYQSLVDFIKS